MTYRTTGRTLLVTALLALAGLTAACESDAERAARLEREALIKAGKMEELQNSLETVNPDPYDPKKAGTKNIGRFKQN